MKRLGGSIKAANFQEGGLSVRLTLPIFEGEKNNEKNTDSRR